MHSYPHRMTKEMPENCKNKWQWNLFGCYVCPEWSMMRRQTKVRKKTRKSKQSISSPLTHPGKHVMSDTVSLLSVTCTQRDKTLNQAELV